MEILPREVMAECREKLLRTKAELFHRIREVKADYCTQDFGGNEGDQSMSVLAENEFLMAQKRIYTQLVEVEQALARMERGAYGLCEETEEPIEVARLKTLPWTRLSIEGAEIREAITKKFA